MRKLPCYISSEHLFCAKDWMACIARAAEIGFDGLELFAAENGVNFVELPVERLDRLAEEALRRSVVLSVHPWVNWGDLDADTLTARYRALFERCARMGVCEVNMHMEFLTSREQGLERLFAATDACLDLLHKHGITLYYENVPAHGVRLIGSEAADFDALFAHYADEERVQMNIDSGHAHIMGIVQSLAETHGDRWKYTHINDNEGREDQHLAPGDGTLDFGAFAKLAAAAGYRGVLMMEYHERGLQTGMETLRRAYGDAGYSLI